MMSGGANNIDLSGVPQYLANGAIMTWEAVVAAYPASSTYQGKFARVSNLFGMNSGALRCESDGTNFFWMPNGMFDYANGNMSVANNQTITALGHPTLINLQGTVPSLTTRDLVLSTDNIWPGARKHITTFGVTSLLGNLRVLSGVTSIVNLALNGVYEIYADYSSGTPQWVRA